MLKTLEQQYQFQYPELYHRLYADQMLDIGDSIGNIFGI